jgi:hypothetical protein
VISHVERFGTFYADLCFENIVGGGIVGFERSTTGRLFVTHFFKSGDDENGLLSIQKRTTSFGFGCRRGNAPKSLAEDVDCTVGFGLRRIGRRSVTEDIDASATTASIREHKIGGVGDYVEDHVAGVEKKGCIWMGGEIIEEMITGGTGNKGRLGLVVGDFVESWEKSIVESTTIVEKSAGNGLDSLSTTFVERGRLVSACILEFLTVSRLRPAMGSMLGNFRLFVAEFVESFGNIVWHGNVDITFIVVPVQSKTQVAGTGPIFGEVVFLLESGKKMISIGFGKIFDAKVVDSKREGGASRVVLPQTWSETKWSVAVRGEMSFELIVSKNCSLFQSVYAFADFQIDITFRIEELVGEPIFINDILRDIAAMDSHILENLHFRAEKEIFEPVQ